MITSKSLEITSAALISLESAGHKASGLSGHVMLQQVFQPDSNGEQRLTGATWHFTSTYIPHRFRLGERVRIVAGEVVGIGTVISVEGSPLEIRGQEPLTVAETVAGAPLPS